MELSFLLQTEISQSLLDPSTGNYILTAAIGSIPGILLYLKERRKNRVALANDEFSYIKVSQEEIIRVYDQLKAVKREFMAAEAQLHSTKIELDDCLESKNDCHGAKERAVAIIHTVENILSNVTGQEIPDILQQIEQFKREHSPKEKNEQLSINIDGSTPS